MKKWLIILLLTLAPGAVLLAQTEADEPAPQEGKIRERMQQYIQDRLSLSRNEAERFTPLFVRYFRDFAQTHKLYRGDNLILKQKIIDLRLRYRTEFRQVMDEQRANKVFKYEDEFRREAINIIRENRRDRLDNKPLRRNRSIVQ
ncbi:MAG TPA: hypothetical protein VMZ03_02325 [Chitinophagaceae bacterium]|nr:hypothetical protein [Chitinophagaceae bacterium]